MSEQRARRGLSAVPHVREEPGHFLFDDAITFAGSILESLAVQYGQMAAAVPDVTERFPLISTPPVEPVNVPFETVSPPLKVWVLALALYCPPETVVRPVTVTVELFASKIPAD